MDQRKALGGLESRGWNPQGPSRDPCTLTFALSLVHDLEIGVAHAVGHEQGALVRVGPAVAAAHGVLQGDGGAVRGAHALRPARLHPAHLPWPALHSLAGLCRTKPQNAHRSASLSVCTECLK